MGEVTADALAYANTQSKRLRDLILRPETLVMPGAYDGLTARLFEAMGFEAIQCASGGIAAGLGYADGEVVTVAETLHVSAVIAGAVTVPVNGDGERGYGNKFEVGDTVRGYIMAGCAGMNLEDSNPHPSGKPITLVPVDRHLEKLEAIMSVKRELGSEFFVNARPDAFLAFRDNPDAALEEAVSRGKIYAAAGADCLFFVGVTSPETIKTLVREIPAPVSILAGPQAPSLSALQDLGVARVSYGTAFARAAGGAIKRLAEEIRESGTIKSMIDAIDGPDMARAMRSARED
jgi:2-methylisocitrate lyase-like PEP mutase family enzyme